MSVFREGQEKRERREEFEKRETYVRSVGEESSGLAQDFGRSEIRREIVDRVAFEARDRTGVGVVLRSGIASEPSAGQVIRVVAAVVA